MGRIDILLEAALCRESRADEEQVCSNCTNNYFAVWRCCDCMVGLTLCRQCMRKTHQHNPLHKIERWTDDHFRSAELWEVGTYLLVRHLSGSGPMLCDALQFQIAHLEMFEEEKDRAEQRSLQHPRRPTAPHCPPAAWTDQDVEMHSDGSQFQPGETQPSLTSAEEDAEEDERFLQRIETLLKGHNESDESADAGAGADPDFDSSNEPDQEGPDHDDLQTFQPYLQTSASTEESNFIGLNNQYARPAADALDNSYVRVIHTNGVHHLAMVSCRCRGLDCLPLDLLAGRLMPASFENIKTLFSTPLLDHFRLCNLELKSSAYQFYQLIRRMTCPLAPASVVNLYHELRRMSRLWRWMKKLKWAGYGHNKKDPRDPDSGELANFCPACPQPGVNLESGWDADADNVIYRRTFVADGNFKADHIAQKGSDLWLYDGGGMGPNQRQYFDFLRTAMESSTVSKACLFAAVYADADADACACAFTISLI